MSVFLDTLTALGASVCTSQGLLRALAVAEGGAPQVSAALAEAGLGGPLLDALAAELPRSLEATLPEAAPEDLDERQAWLEHLDLADRARRALAALAGPEPAWAAAVRRGLDERVAVCARGVAGAPWAWQHARWAAGLGSELLPEILRPGVPEEPDEDLIEAWAAGCLHPEDEARLRARVANPGVWQTAWRAWLGRTLGALDLEFLGSPFDRVGPRALATVALPHLGPSAALVVRGSARGTIWSWPGREPTLHPWSSREVELDGDGVTGPLVVRPAVYRRDGLDAGSRVLDDVAGLLEASGSEQVEALALSAAGALRSALWRGRLRALADDFRLGRSTEDPGWALLAVQLRELLDRIASDLLLPELFDVLEWADAELEPYAEAALTIADEVWEERLGRAVLDPEAWWGRRVALGARVNEIAVADALIDLGRAGWFGLHRRFLEMVTRSCGAAEDRLARYAEALRALAPAPASAGLLLADTGGSSGAGRAPVLAVLDGREVGVVLEIVVSFGQGPGDPWELAPRLKQGARFAVRQAFRAAAALTCNKLPPRSFERHRITLLPGDAPLSVDGESLALSAALAFASLWTGLPLWRDLAASATLSAQGSSGTVGRLDQKQTALGLLAASGEPVRLLVAQDQAGDEVPGVRLVRVATLWDALSQAGLADAMGALAGDPFTEVAEECLDTLHRFVQAAKSQNLASFRHGGDDSDAWLDLADGLVQLADASTARGLLRGEDVVEPLAWAALAYSYGGDHAAAGALTRRLDIDQLSPGAPRVFLAITLLTHRINGEIWEGGERDVDALVEQLAQLDCANERKLRGLALGTVGRFWMHRRGDGWAERALPLLRSAVEHHRAHPEVQIETPRSRTYLAMALRMSGGPAAALAELDTAQREIDASLVGRAYGATTAIFVQYERARALLDLGRVAEAESAGRDAVRRMEEVGWKVPGPYRTLAWVCRELGDAAGAQAAIASLTDLVGSRGGLPRRILDEALGPYRKDGEVF